MPKKKKEKKLRSVKEVERECTPKQSAYLKYYLKTHDKTKSAILAGYSPKSAGQAGYHVHKKLQEKCPQVFDRIGLTLERVIQKKLIPLMDATEVKVAQQDGVFTDALEVDALGIQLGATRMYFELADAFPPRDQMLAAQIGVEIIVNDMPRPHRPTVDVQAYLAAQRRPPTNGNKRRIEEKAGKNGDDDPRPKD